MIMKRNIYSLKILGENFSGKCAATALIYLLLSAKQKKVLDEGWGGGHRNQFNDHLAAPNVQEETEVATHKVALKFLSRSAPQWQAGALVYGDNLKQHL